MDKASSAQHLESLTAAFDKHDDAGFQSELNSMKFDDRAAILRDFAKQEGKGADGLPVIELTETSQGFVTDVKSRDAEGNTQPLWSEGWGQAFMRNMSESSSTLSSLFSAADTTVKAAPSSSSESVAAPSAGAP